MKTFLVWFPDDGKTEDDATEVVALDTEEAVMGACNTRHDDPDYVDEIDGDPISVMAKAPDGTVTRWVVSAMTQVHYIAEVHSNLHQEDHVDEILPLPDESRWPGWLDILLLGALVAAVVAVVWGCR